VLISLLKVSSYLIIATGFLIIHLAAAALAAISLRFLGVRLAARAAPVPAFPEM
jgi:hypothetical protein